MDDWDSIPIINKEKNKKHWFGEDEDEEVRDSWEQDIETDNNKIIKKKVEITLTEHKGLEYVTGNEEKQLEILNNHFETYCQIPITDKQDPNKKSDVLESETKLKTEFDHLKDEIKSKIDECEKNENYVEFVKRLVPRLCSYMTPYDIKRIHNIIGNIHLEKAKMDKSNKPIKNKYKLKAQLRVDNEIDIRNYDLPDDFYDF